MKISFLVPDLSNNIVGRAHMLSRLLSSKYETEIAGPLMTGEPWAPVFADGRTAMKSVRVENPFHAWPRLLTLGSRLDGDVFYVCKPYLSSLGLAHWAARRRRVPVILDLDDWDEGFLADFLGRSPVLHSIRVGASLLTRSHGQSYGSLLAARRLVRRSAALTVASPFLARLYPGALVVPHCRDETHFDPSRFFQASSRAKFGFDRSQKIVMFCGVPRPHKGLEDLIDAMASVGVRDAVLSMPGMDVSDPYARRLDESARRTLGERYHPMGLIPYADVPEALSVADVVVIPQRAGRGAEGQMPAKVIDAMAMGRAIVATRVGQLPEALAGCADFVEPGDVKGLAAAIRRALENPEVYSAMREKARQVFLENYSYSKVAPGLVSLVGRVLASRPPRTK